MPLSREAVIEFQQAYKDSFGEDIAFDEANLMARELLYFINSLRKAPPALSTDPDLTKGSVGSINLNGANF